MGDAESGSASRTELLHTTCGTPNYVAPEVLADQGYDGKKADVWSIGVILYVLLAGFLPFDEPTIVALFAKIQSADFSYPSWFTPEAREVLDRILVVDPKKRISLKELKAHPWLAAAFAASEASALVPPLDLSQRAQEDHSAIRDEHQDDDSDGDEEGGSDGDPSTLNAFDLVAQCGGFMMSRLYMPLAPDAEGRLGRKGGRFSFTSATPPAALYEAVRAAMTERGYTLYANFPRKMLVKGTLLTPKGAISLLAQVFLIAGSSSTCLLEIRRGKGDLLEFHAALTDLVDNKLITLINKPKADGEAKSDSSA